MLGAGGHFAAKDEAGRDKPLNEMTMDELAIFIRKQNTIIAAGGEPPVITITDQAH